MTRNKKWSLQVATLGPLGHCVGSGTLATVATIPVAYLLSAMAFPFYIHVALIVSLFVGCWFVCRYALTHCIGKDPREVVIDEFIGCLVTFVGVPINSVVELVLGVALFRFFDISKWCGIRKIEQLGTVWGIMLDDVVAGIFSNVLLRLIISYW